jgi:hypothetical protein
MGAQGTNAKPFAKVPAAHEADAVRIEPHSFGLFR